MPSISIGQHLINRLKEINIDVIFGVPGDFNMVCTIIHAIFKRRLIFIFHSALVGYYRR